MTPDTVIEIAKNAIITIAYITGPLMITGLVVGVLVSLFQSVTQINEPTLSFIPKLLAVGGVLLLAGHWMLEYISYYTQELYLHIPTLIGIR